MHAFLVVLGFLGWVLFALALIVAWRFYKKLVTYDNVFTFLSDDILTNLRHFAKMRQSGLTSNEPEIIEAHRLMGIMNVRMEEILRRMMEATGLDLTPPPPPPRPKVI